MYSSHISEHFRIEYRVFLFILKILNWYLRYRRIVSRKLSLFCQSMFLFLSLLLLFDEQTDWISHNYSISLSFYRLFNLGFHPNYSSEISPRLNFYWAEGSRGNVSKSFINPRGVFPPRNPNRIRFITSSGSFGHSSKATNEDAIGLRLTNWAAWKKYFIFSSVEGDSCFISRFFLDPRLKKK